MLFQHAILVFTLYIELEDGALCAEVLVSKLIVRVNKNISLQYSGTADWVFEYSTADSSEYTYSYEILVYSCFSDNDMQA